VVAHFPRDRTSVTGTEPHIPPMNDGNTVTSGSRGSDERRFLFSLSLSWFWMFFPVLDVVSTKKDQSTRLRTLVDGPSWIPLSTILRSSHHHHHHDHHEDKEQRRKTFLMVSQIFEEGLFQFGLVLKTRHDSMPRGDVRPSATFCNDTRTTFVRIDFKDSSLHSNAFVVVSGKSHIHNNPDDDWNRTATTLLLLQ
jgi:hypothetical protein